jgi:hypothetical protein
LFFRTEVGGLTADSKDARSKGVLAFKDNLTLQVVDAKSGAPYADQKTKIKLADGSTKSKTTDGSGKVELKEIPPGPAKVKLPGLGAPTEEQADAPEGARDAIAKPSGNGSSKSGTSKGKSSQGSALGTQVVTGSAWRVWVARGGGLPTG